MEFIFPLLIKKENYKENKKDDINNKIIWKRTSIYYRRRSSRYSSITISWIKNIKSHQTRMYSRPWSKFCSFVFIKKKEIIDIKNRNKNCSKSIGSSFFKKMIKNK